MKVSMRRFAIFAACFLGQPLTAADGSFLLGASPASEALGGAGTGGNRLDMLGSVARNPATAVLFDGCRTEVAVGVVRPNVEISSSIAALGAAGSSRSSVTRIPYVDLGLLRHRPSEDVALYAALISEAGLGLEVPASMTNPVFAPPALGGLGGVESAYQLVRLDLGAAWRRDGRWQLGAAISPSFSRLRVDPFFMAAPDDADGDGHPTYPVGDQTALAFGIGGKAGVRFQPCAAAAIGLAATSPTWFQDATVGLRDEAGGARTGRFRIDRPPSAGLGATLSPLPGTDILLEGGWIGYGRTAGFADGGLAADGSLRGFGWRSIWTAAIGIQQACAGGVTLRAGANWCRNPIAAEDTFINLASPLHGTRSLSGGLDWAPAPGVGLGLALTHSFAHEQSGPIYGASGPLAGTSISTRTGSDVVVAGVHLDLP